MNTYEAFIHDDRYSVPTLSLVSAENEATARAIAESLLLASPHHLGVELCRNGEPIAALGACAERRPTADSAQPLRLAE